MKVYITKHVLTDGIQEREAELCNDPYSRMSIIRVRNDTLGGFSYYGEPDWHESLDDAKKQAFKMVNEGLRYLDNQTARLLELREKLSRSEQ